jgi:hypothetical protein
LDEIQSSIYHDFVSSTVMSLVVDTSDEDSDDVDERHERTLFQVTLCSSLENTRYLFRDDVYRSDVRRGNEPAWMRILRGEMYNEEEFLRFFRIPKALFLHFADLLKDSPVFAADKKQRKHYSHYLHLMVMLKYFGSEGGACSATVVKDGLGIGKGTVMNYVDRSVSAVLQFRNRSIFWPGPEERQAISNRIRDSFMFPKVVGTVDGTHLGLSTRPVCHGEDYFSRKSNYAVVAMVVNDDKRRIRYLNIGWPASVHDERVYSNCSLSLAPNDFFSAGEYLLGDSAFSNRSTLVPAFKKLANTIELPVEKKHFNTLLASVRVLSEHTIGIWKGRFPWLRSIPIRITGERSMQRLIRYVTATAMLHNFFVQHNPPPSWIVEEDRDDEFLAELEEHISEDMTDEQGSRGDRRSEVMNYLRELIDFH